MKLSPSWLRAIVYTSFVSYVIYTMLRTLAHLPYYSGTAFGINLLLLSFVWVAGFCLSRRDIRHETALKDIALLFCGHVALAAAIQFGFRMKHHEVGKFSSIDLVSFVAPCLILLAIFLLFRKFVVPDRPSLHRSSFLRTLGDVSYPLYMTHIPVYAILIHFGWTSPLLLYLIAVVVSAFVYWSVDFYSKARHPKIGVN
jgi:peptidoglycan/LPS O-acetylase OafA/YrhL